MARRSTARLHLLTARGVHKAGDGDHSDGGNLLLRVRGESASWVFRYTAPSGKRRDMGLGVSRHGSLPLAGESLTGARDLAHKARELLRQGLDPLAERDSRRQAAAVAEVAKKVEKAKDRLTLARAARGYHERVIEPTRTPKHAAQWISSLENHVPADLWHAPLSSITAPELLKALEGVTPHERARNLTTDGGKVPETVRRIRQRLESVFEDAQFHGQVASNPAAAIRRKMRESEPGRKARKTKGGRGFKALPYKEAPAFMGRLRAMPGTAARTLEFAVLTVARTSEALLAEWGEFDLEAGVWTVPASRMKAGEPHLVHLSSRALDLIKGQAGQHARWVFPSTMKGCEDKPQSNMAMLTVLTRMNMRDKTTVHGLCRATFSTWANETGVARPDVIEACLAHQEGNLVRAAYNRAQFAMERRALLQAWADYLAKIAANLH